MAQIYVNIRGLEQRNVQTEEQIRHIRRFIQLVKACREIDTMHQNELRDMQARLERMEQNLRQMMDVTEAMMRKYLKMDREIQDQLKMIQKKSSHQFE